jgi:hypothetical protein
MALNDIKVPKENAQGTFDEIALAASDLKLGTTANLPLKTGTGGVIEAGSFGTAAGSFCAGDDARLSDDRDPNLHAASHLPDGADELFDQSLNADDDVMFNSVSAADNSGTLKMDGYGLLWEGNRRWDLETSSFLDTQGDPMLELATENSIKAYLPIDFAGEDAATNAATTRTNLGLGDAAVEDTTAFAASGSITTSGLTQSTARILGRTTASTGSIEEIQIGSGLSLSAGQLSATSSGGISAVGASTADVLSVSGSDLVADDPNADRIVFWDDSESKLRYLEAGTGLSISGTTMTATSTFDPASPAALGTTTPNTAAFTSLTGAPAANTAAYAVTGYSLTGSNAQSVIDLAGTWNTTGTPSAFKLNVTDTASNASSLLMQLQTGGTNRFTVAKGGGVTAGGTMTATAFATAVGSGEYSGAPGFPTLRAGGVNGLCVTNNSNVFVCANGGWSIGWAITDPTGTTRDVAMWRDAAATWALRDGVNAQEMRCYGTFTSSTNYQRMTVKSVKQTLSALSGASATTTGTFIPDGAVVVGVTTRVGTALTGATGYTIGDGTDADRWGDITGTAIGTTSDNANWTAGTIECFTVGGNVTLTANGSNFTAGAIEICVFYLAGQAD